jgi:UDP-N-acetylglucosamine 2-epimerase
VDVLVGNSSAGIIEAATFGLPVVNVGGRQAGRERNANVLDVPFSAAAVRRGVRKALTDRAFLARVRRRKNLYGDGRAAGRIVGVLEQLAAGPRRAVAALVMKRFADGRGEMGGKAQPGVSTRG